MPNPPAQIRYCECFARDGLQNLPLILPTAAKIEMIDRFTEAGIPIIEATSFAHPKYLPQFFDAEEVLKGIRRKPGTHYVGLIPNAKGLDRALDMASRGHGITATIVIAAASEAYNKKNVNRTVEESLAELGEVVPRAKKEGIHVIASIPTSFGCHLEGPIPVGRVAGMASRLRDWGADEIMFGDTTGVANPVQVGEFYTHMFQHVPGVTLTAHFHDTRGTAMANAHAAWQAGVTRFDGSLGGIGGRPHGLVEGADARHTGNVASEDLLAMFEQCGVATGISLDRMISTVRRAESLLGQRLHGHLADTGPVGVKAATPHDH